MRFTKATRYRANCMGQLSTDASFARSVAAQEAARWTEYALLATARRRAEVEAA